MTPRAIPDSALRLVAAYFDAATIARALAHARDDRVHVVKPPPWPIVARVREAAGYVVTVHYNPVANHLRGDCSCPIGNDCEHVAAAALVAFAGERVHAEAHAEAAREALVGEWLAELGRVGDDDPAPVASADRAVAYVIDLRDGELGLTAVQCPRLTTGGLGMGTPIGALGDPQRGAPRWVAVEDLRRIALLRAVTRAAPQVTRLRFDRLPADLLRELADSGQLFWESSRAAPLAYGPPIRERLAWRATAGGFRLGVDEPRVIAPARACHYIDPIASAIGPLDLGVAPGLVARLIASPPVPAAMRATVERSLRPLLTEAAGPLWRTDDPAPAPAPAPAIEPMQPRMIASLDPERRNTIRVIGQARYGDAAFALAAWDAARPVARDLVAEGRCLARLQALLAGLPHGVAAATSLELLANARHLAEAIVPRLRALGWSCVLDDDFPRDAPLVDVAWVEELRPLGESRGWFALELGVTIAGRTVPLLPILLQAIRDGQLVIEPGGATAVAAGLNLRLPDGELIHVPAERVQRWLRPLIELELAGLDAAGALAIPAVVAAQLETDGGFGGAIELTRARDRLAALIALAPRHEPAEFGGTLRDYQRLGLAWLRFLHDAGYGGLLADEMGLGKTVQVLAFLEGLRVEGGLAGPALVIAPRSVLGNWQREAARFAPGLRAIVHVGAERAQDAAGLTVAPLVITSYQTLVRDLALFRARRWATVVFDEAQALKNPDTQLRAAAAALVAGSRFAITGTPIENHLGELWSQIDLVMPGLLGRRRAFEATYRRAIEQHGDVTRLELLRQRIRPFLLRRTKAQVERDLPAKTEIIERIELDSAQRDLYETLRLMLDARVRAALARRGVQGASMVILDALLKLRQCCCDPRLVKLPEARELTSSAKLERLIDMLEELADSGRATLVFSQFATMLGLIGTACAQAGIPYLILTGATRDRDDVIRRFQDGEAKLLLISLKAGGVGLNLTRADTVIHYDPWWNPAAEAQATDRAHRIGQDRPVMVYKLVARGTLEEEICKLQDEKRLLTDAALRDGGVTHLVAEDLRALYQRIV